MLRETSSAKTNSSAAIKEAVHRFFSSPVPLDLHESNSSSWIGRRLGVSNGSDYENSPDLDKQIPRQGQFRRQQQPRQNETATIDPSVIKRLMLSPPDPPHPNCSESSPKARFALALYGSVSSNTKNGGNLEAKKGRGGYTDLPLSAFIDVTQIRSSLEEYLLRPSGGTARFDVFIHSWVQSTAVQSKLLSSYHPTAARFDNEYSEVWGRGHTTSSVAHGMKASEVSRITSASRALRLVRDAEVARGAAFRYEKVYLARPDVDLWRAMDLRRYCSDRIYINNQCPPFHTHHRDAPSGCWGVGFHYSRTLKPHFPA